MGKWDPRWLNVEGHRAAQPSGVRLLAKLFSIILDLYGSLDVVNFEEDLVLYVRVFAPW